MAISTIEACDSIVVLTFNLTFMIVGPFNLPDNRIIQLTQTLHIREPPIKWRFKLFNSTNAPRSSKGKGQS